MSGQRRALATMMPLSIEKESLGRPAMPQARILTASPRLSMREKRAERGMPILALLSTHLPITWGRRQGGWGGGPSGKHARPPALTSCFRTFLCL